MGSRSTARPRRWIKPALTAAAAALLLTGCSAETTAQWGRLGMPESASDRAPFIGDLWTGSWIAALAVGVFVWGLIGWAGFRYRRRKRDGEVAPRQTRYNLPMEILYTLTPLLIVGVLFVFTVQTQNKVLAGAEGSTAGVSGPQGGSPDRVIDVVGQKWSWTFNYRESQTASGGTDVWETGTINASPDLYLPVNQTVRFNLTSPDVIHSFWVPAFYFKMDAIPGRPNPNTFDMTPTREGVFIGKCAELCGTYHSAMIFRVHVVSEEEYEAKLAQLEEAGNVGTNYGSRAYVEPDLAPQGGEAEGEGE
ncbi:aa3-type cytochrome oxidase subunit II [Desertihabitans brevis]|nr:cytochrome c oxidase subunit II [Desertihabitans brevis]